MQTSIPTLSLLVTYQCNIECKHCGPYCGPKERDWMSIEEIKDLCRQAGEAGAHNVVFTGGEPTLLKDRLIEALCYVRDETSIDQARMVSNAAWATNYDKAHQKLKAWKEAGLTEVNFSCGEYHQEFVPISRLVHAYRAARDLDYSTVLLVGEFLKDGKGKMPKRAFRTQLEEELGERFHDVGLRSPYVTECHSMACNSAMAYGRGKNYLSTEDIDFFPESEIPSTCEDVLSIITAHPNGHVTACCGVMMRKESLLNIGNWREQPLRRIVDEANKDIILNWIRYVGLRDMKAWLQEKDDSLEFRKEYTSICDLCAEIVYSDKCQKLLIDHGSERQGDIVLNKVASDATAGGEHSFQYTQATNA